MKVLTCNIRYIEANDGDNSWSHRREMCIDIIAAQAPDIVCFQELRAPQFIDLQKAFPEFECYALPPEAGGLHPQNGIFYRRSEFSRIASGGFWLSETPHIAGTKSWDSCCVRLANWVRLRAGDREFRVVNTHLDHISQIARERQAALIADEALAYAADYPQILTGDLNCDCDNPANAILKSAGWSDSYGAVHGTENPGFTYHEFAGANYESDIGKMDWIYVRGNVSVQAAAVIDEHRDGRYPSDHYFVSAELSLS